MNYLLSLKQYLFYKSPHNYESKHLKFPIFTLSFSDKLWSFSLSSFSWLLSNNKENGKESVLGSGFHLGVLLLSKDLCFLPFISFYHFLTFPLLFIAFMLPPETLCPWCTKLQIGRRGGEMGYCVKSENTKFKSMNCCPFTSEMFVKHERGIVITVMHYFYF